MIYLDDDFIEHPKVQRAGLKLGDDGAALVVMVYLAGLRYARKYLTDGFIPDDFVVTSNATSRTVAVVKALSDGRSEKQPLWRRVRGGYQIHDYHSWNRKASDIKEKREKDRAKKRARRHPVPRGVPEGVPEGHIGESPGVSREDSIHVPRTTYHVPDRTSVLGTHAPTPEVLPTEGSRASSARARPAVPRSVPAGHRADAPPPPAPLIPSPLAVRSYAYPNEVVGVPAFCHTRYVQRLTNAGVDRSAAERQLLDWYDDVCRQYRGQRIGDKEADFWDQRFEEWQGRTPKATATSTGSVAARNAAFLRQRQERSS